MARKGLGKGLDSLIPDFYNEDFDSNSTQSLEDLLEEDATEIVEKPESSKKEKETSKKDVVEEIPEEIPQKEEISEGDVSKKEVSDEDINKVNNKKTQEVEDTSDIKKETPEEKIVDEVQKETPEEEIVEEVQKETPEEEIVEEVSEETPQDEAVEIKKESSEIIEEEPPEPQINYNPEHVEEVKKIVDKNPRITLWSSKSSAVFRYLRKTEPEFSISKEASLLIEEAVSKKYPEIWALFDNDQ